MKIESLTPEQKAELPKFVEKWTKIGLCTDPADRPMAEKAVKEAYAKVGLAEPKHILWADSPEAGQKLLNSIRGTKEWTDPFYGQHEAEWLAFYDVFRSFGLDMTKIDPITTLAQSCGWVWMFNDGVICTERPKSIHLDSRNRLHSENGMAIQYPDGWGLYFIHGVKVDEKIVMRPTELTVKEIDDHPNAEVRRTMISRYGESSFLLKAGAKLVAQDEFGMLYRREIPGDEALTMVRVKNSTPEPDGETKIYWLRVPPNVATPQEGIAWTFNLKEKDYIPQIMT